MTEPSELIERLSAVIDPRYSDEFVGKMIRSNWPDIHAALSAMTDPLAMAKAMRTDGCSCESGGRLCDHCCMVDDFVGRVPLNGTICVPDALYRRVCHFLAIDPASLEVNHADQD